MFLQASVLKANELDRKVCGSEYLLSYWSLIRIMWSYGNGSMSEDSSGQWSDEPRGRQVKLWRHSHGHLVASLWIAVVNAVLFFCCSTRKLPSSRSSSSTRKFHIRPYTDCSVQTTALTVLWKCSFFTFTNILFALFENCVVFLILSQNLLHLHTFNKKVIKLYLYLIKRD